MKPIKFKGTNCIFAEDQSEYSSLPAHKAPNGVVVSCWSLSTIERVKMLFTGRIWLSVWTFNRPLQPLFLSINKTDVL